MDKLSKIFEVLPWSDKHHLAWNSSQFRDNPGACCDKISISKEDARIINVFPLIITWKQRSRDLHILINCAIHILVFKIILFKKNTTKNGTPTALTEW